MATQVLTEFQIFEPSPALANNAASQSPKSDGRSAETRPAARGLRDTEAPVILSKGRTVIVISYLIALTVFNSFCNGVIVVGLPAIASSLHLEEDFGYGRHQYVAGTRRVNLIGAFLGAIFAVAFGLARTGGELIAFRALQGIANAIFVPSSVSIVSQSVEDGRPRNIGFSCLGFSQPIGFSVGLVLGGVFVDTVGWRVPFYIAGAVIFASFFIGVWVLPQDVRVRTRPSVWRRLLSEIDWVGALIASTGLATLSYILAVLSDDINNIHRPSNIALLTISGISVPAFIGWMHYQVKSNRVALIPNYLWRNSTFVSSCIIILLTSAVTNCMELYTSLFFQDVQDQSALEASLRILPSLIVGALAGMTTGIFVNRMPVMWAAFLCSAITAGAPLLMALIHASWPYWYDAFFAQVLAPVSGDVLFTVGLLIRSDVFPAHMQALGGAVFNTCAQVGTAIGLTLTSLIASSVTKGSNYHDKSSAGALGVGYRAVFWTLFAWMIAVCVVSVLGYRRIGGVGMKRD
ncbi:hypothetical protein N7468_009151 [Penicillium chermesinum]|uniref:Major facilitator superfamily (MFS) profile domain-containing protein n=1 Tax=Penicillium chermesinum TaxID=63820 RepID=A0A9W9TEK5_9EURO|nr:uncharacterized protein N7468_009151 [Penicillium chermesinum]KAJ5219947.1 hypothetical protein N7468_009151 [Penicillium chermesinum]